MKFNMTGLNRCRSQPGFSPKQPETKVCRMRFVWKFDPREWKLEESQTMEEEKPNVEHTTDMLVILQLSTTVGHQHSSCFCSGSLC